MRRPWAIWLLIALLTALLPPPPAAAGETGHWAAPHVARVNQALGWTPPGELDTPIPALEWNRLVALLAGEPPGDADPNTHPRQHWVWMYTGGMAREQTVLRREDAIGGLMKLVSILYQEKGFAAEPAVLNPFTDGPKVADHQQVLLAGAVQLGLVTGYPGNLLQPSRPLTYAEGVTLIARLLERYGDPASPVTEPAPRSRFPQPRGFAVGTDLDLPVENVIHAGWPVGTAGTAWWVINGAAYAAELPGAGEAPEGKLWVVVDVEMYNWDFPEMVIAPDALRFTLDHKTEGLVEYRVDEAASTALGSPFGKETVVLKQGESLRGFVVFAVPAGTRSIWMQCDSKLGLGPGKTGWNGMSRTPLGDLPALEQR
ncbi:MAG: S-layer homology domain-containing protein [Bacillota bacterium]